MLVLGGDLRGTLALAVEFETLCEQYWRACQLGEPHILSSAEMDEVLALFKTYASPRPTPQPPGGRTRPGLNAPPRCPARRQQPAPDARPRAWCAACCGCCWIFVASIVVFGAPSSS